MSIVQKKQQQSIFGTRVTMCGTIGDHAVASSVLKCIARNYFSFVSQHFKEYNLYLPRNFAANNNRTHFPLYINPQVLRTFIVSLRIHFDISDSPLFLNSLPNFHITLQKNEIILFHLISFFTRLLLGDNTALRRLTK